MFQISVVICTHNPKGSVFERVMRALRQQTLPLEYWELLIIDNASRVPVADTVDISWHQNARIICEGEMGLTPARLRGVNESVGEIIVFVDDDNVLAADYLEQVVSTALSVPFVGAFNGSVVGEFEIEPTGEIASFTWALGLSVLTRPIWSNRGVPDHEVPFGVGLCVRRVVAERWGTAVCNDPRRRSLDRKGLSLMSCGDTDLALTAVDAGLGVGRFPNLQTKHFIAAERLEEPYLLRLAESLAYSSILLKWIRGEYRPPGYCPISQRLFTWYHRKRALPFHSKWDYALERGTRAAHDAIGKNVKKCNLSQ